MGELRGALQLAGKLAHEASAVEHPSAVVAFAETRAGVVLRAVADEASMDQIKNVRLRFLPDSSSRAMLDSVSLRKKVPLKDIASLGMSYTGGESDGGSTGGGGTSGGGNDNEPVVENPGD